jgi:hypothetical protein
VILIIILRIIRATVMKLQEYFYLFSRVYNLNLKLFKILLSLNIKFCVVFVKDNLQCGTKTP